MAARMKNLLLIILLTLSCSLPGAIASEFRAYTPILIPRALPGGAAPQAAKVIRPVSNKVMAKVVVRLIRAWNRNGLDKVLSNEFFDRTRLNDAMSNKVPRDAALTVLSIQSIQTLNQHIESDERGRLMVSLVSVRIRTQLEFNDPANGFQRREGTNEYIFRVKQRMRG